MLDNLLDSGVRAVNKRSEKKNTLARITFYCMETYNKITK